MANFCKYCGKPLTENAVCACREQVPAQPAQPAQPVQPAPTVQSVPLPTNYQAPVSFAPPTSPPPTPPVVSAQPVYQVPEQPVGQVPEKGPSFDINAIGKTLLNLLKAPVTTAREVVGKADHLLTMLLIGVESLMMALFFLTMALKYNGWMNVGDMPSSMSKQIAVSWVGALLTALVLSALMAVVLAGLVTLFVKVMKGEADFKQVLSAVGVKAFFMAPFVVVALLVMLIGGTNVLFNFYVPIAILIAGTIIGAFVMVKALKDVVKTDEDKAVYVTGLSVVTYITTLFLFVAMTVGIWAPKDAEWSIGDAAVAYQTVSVSKAKLDDYADFDFDDYDYDYDYDYNYDYDLDDFDFDF